MDRSLREQLLGIFAETKTIAVVDASADSSKPAHQIPRYLQRQSYRILPVNPRGGELLGGARRRRRRWRTPDRSSPPGQVADDRVGLLGQVLQ